MFNSRELLNWFLTVLVGVGVLVLIFVGRGVFVWSNSLSVARTIVVDGEGEVVLKPNVSVISFSVISEGENAVALQDDNNKKINEAIALIKKQSVDDKDIKTTGYNLSPRYRYEPKTGKSYIEGYTLTQTVTVKIRNLDNVSRILSALPSVGINQINGPNFSVDDLENYLNEARAEAFKNAHKKAELLASANGVRLGRVMTFYEGSAGQPPIMYLEKSAYGMGGDGPMPVPPQIEVGSEEVKVRVSVTFEIR